MKLTECRTLKDLAAVYSEAVANGYSFFDDDDGSEIIIDHLTPIHQGRNRVIIAYANPEAKGEVVHPEDKWLPDYMTLDENQKILIISRLSEEDVPDSDPYFTLTIPCHDVLGSDHRDETDVDTLFFRVTHVAVVGDIDFNSDDD